MSVRSTFFQEPPTADRAKASSTERLKSRPLVLMAGIPRMLTRREVGIGRQRESEVGGGEGGISTRHLDKDALILAYTGNNQTL